MGELTPKQQLAELKKKRLERSLATKARTALKYEIVKTVAKMCNTHIGATTDVIDTFFLCLKKNLDQGKNVNIKGWGTYHVRLRKGRYARIGFMDGGKGRAIQTEDKTVVIFKPCRELRKLVASK